MTINIELIRKEQLQVSTWSGGTTTQLAIYPKDAVYSERNFQWRLSSAKVEVEESVFTSLPNINRIIMILEGQLKLEHEGHHKCVLEPFQQDYFSGSWNTKSYGKVTDFNLMMGEGCQGELEAIHLSKGQYKPITFNRHQNFLHHLQGVYCVNGQTAVELFNEEVFILNDGDLLLITGQEKKHELSLKIYNENDEKVDLVRVEISY